MRSKTIFALVAVFVLLGAAYATGPLLQVTNYTTIPSEIYPGTLGYLQLTLSNQGDTAAGSVSVNYFLDDIGKSLSMGDVGVGSSSQVSIPFKIPPQSAGSINLLNVDIYYSYTSGTSVQNKKTSLTVPLIVKQYKPLQVATKSTDKSAISPGEKITLNLELDNTGGVVNNLVITAPENSTFSIDGSTQISVGNVQPNSTSVVSLTLDSSSDTRTGTYNVPLTFTYQDSLKQPTAETFNIGPVSVLDSSSQYRVTLVPTEPVEIGSQVNFVLTLENTGSSPMSGTLDINTTDTFTPIGVQRIYFDAVPAKGKISQNITLGVSASKTSGYYMLPLRLTPNAGQSATYNAGIAVDATPEITVTFDSQSGTPTVQIANTGNSQIRSVYLSAKPAGAQAALQSFVGTLNVDDFASLPVPNSAGRSVDVIISFKDSNNQVHTVTKTLEAAGNSSFVQSGRAGAGFGGNGSQGGGRNGNPLGFLFGAGGRASSSGGPDALAIVVVAVIVIAGGYLAYRKFYKGKKKQLPGAAPAASEKGRKPQ